MKKNKAAHSTSVSSFFFLSYVLCFEENLTSVCGSCSRRLNGLLGKSSLVFKKDAYGLPSRAMIATLAFNMIIF
jgi:hypothetical protein